MIICDQYGTCCNWQYCNKREGLDEEGRQCSHIMEVKEVVYAKWLDHHGFDKCSACGFLGEGISNFCPNCGAEMKEDNLIEEEDGK